MRYRLTPTPRDIPNALSAAYRAARLGHDPLGPPTLLELLALSRRVNALLREAGQLATDLASASPEQRPRVRAVLLILEHLARGVLEDVDGRAFPLELEDRPRVCSLVQDMPGGAYRCHRCGQTTLVPVAGPCRAES